MITLIRRVADNYKAVQRLSQDAGMTVLALVEELALLLPAVLGPTRNRRAGSVSAAPEYDEHMGLVTEALGSILSTDAGVKMLMEQGGE